MKGIRILVWFGFGLVTMSVVAQFTLNLSPVSPGAAELTFTREPGYYYCLESFSDLTGTFTPASAWIAGDGMATMWPLTYPTSPATSGGGQVASNTTFSLYPFDDGKTLVTWNDAADTRYSAIVIQNYTALPPTVIIPENTPAPSLFLLIGRIPWNDAYDALQPALLPAAQQNVFSQFTTRHADILAATAGSPGPGVVAQTEKQFYRIRRVEADADGDGLDWAAEMFVLGLNPDEVDSDRDGYEDGIEIANGTDPADFFDGNPPKITIVDGDAQLAWAGQFNDLPLMVRVAKADGLGVPNHKVVFSASFAGFAANKAPTAPLSATFEATTNNTGYALVFFRQPNVARATTVIHAQTQGKTASATASVDFWTYSVGGDLNGPDAPENLNGEWIEGITTEVESYELTWQDTSNDEIEFIIERSYGDEAHWIPVGVVAANITSWRDYSLNLDDEVFYRVTSVGL